MPNNPNKRVPNRSARQRAVKKHPDDKSGTP